MFVAKLSLLAILLVAVASAASVGEEIQKYQELASEWKEHTGTVLKEAKSRMTRDLEETRQAVEAGVMQGKRRARDAPETPNKLDEWIGNIKEGWEKAVNSEQFQKASQKFSEIGDAISEAGKKIGSQIQESISKVSSQ